MKDETKQRADLKLVLDAQTARLDAARPDAVARQRKRGRWTARQALEVIADEDSFVEYGGLVRPATKGMAGAADGLVMGTLKIDGRAANIVLYDYSVYAGTQSAMNHVKISRMFLHAEKHRLPVICWLDGGGARPHDMHVTARPSTETFVVFARLSGLVPTVGISPGRAFAGHANLAGLCDVLIATEDSAMGMAGPPLVEAALGKKYTPEEIGSSSVHWASGVIDILVKDEAEAIAAAKRYLGYFEMQRPPGEAPDQMALRDMVPENPRRAYNVRNAVQTLCDIDSVMEVKAGYGKAAVTAFGRIAGRTVGIIANQPMYLAGAMDTPACLKMARFVQICDAFDIPLVVLCDTPGLMVGPEVEKTGLMRHSARVLSALANATVPVLTVVLRKAYGLGYYIMGSRPLEPAILLAWPTAEFGGMGLEGAVNIIHAKELEAAATPEARTELHARLTAELKRSNTAVESGAKFLYDDVIDPADTRAILIKTLDTLPQPAPRAARKRIIEPF
ncbi:MAG: hypothetical protein JOY90_12620 [Bradyrhizobium sp.]|uniref:acyl-CoA carboxylase subunit beta n=1 Tax=Bradyrhizobium sp. TaxID=376 RepID=UPI001D2466E9|nr:carboxyl transferase domain-containing protein [Bradyrhizobium sp.]MBV9561278.1 hypothetical protein [Bradyrhizobium sp.]